MPSVVYISSSVQVSVQQERTLGSKDRLHCVHAYTSASMPLFTQQLPTSGSAVEAQLCASERSARCSVLVALRCSLKRLLCSVHDEHHVPT
jgi:hypothetical protein